MRPTTAASLAIALAVGLVVVLLVSNRHSPSGLAVEPGDTIGDSGPGGGDRLPRLLSLGAEWCPPCRQMRPVRAELRQRYRGQLVVEYIDVDENKAAARQHRVRAVPTIIFYGADGKQLLRRTGYMNTEDVVQAFARKGVRLTVTD